MNSTTEKRKIFTKNFFIFFAISAFYNIALLFMQDSIIQTFLRHYGVSNRLLGIYTTLLNIVNVSAMMFSSQLSNKSKNAATTIMKACLTMAISFFGFLPICLSTGKLSAGVVFAIALSVGIVQFLANAVRDVFAYKLPYQIIDMRDYPILVSVNGIIYGVACIVASAIFAWFLEIYKYEHVMAASFTAAAIFMLFAALLNSRYKLTFTPEEKSENGEVRSLTIKELLLLPEFKSLIIPNFLRGIATGTVSMIAVMALNLGYTATDTAYLATLRSAAGIIGSLLFALIGGKINSRFICFGGAIVMLVMPMLALPTKWVFFAVYLIVYVAKMMVDYAVPTIIYRVTPYEIAGSYHAWRLLIMNAGTALGTYLVGEVIDYVPTAVILAVAAVAQLLSSTGYCFAKPIRKPSFSWGKK